MPRRAKKKPDEYLAHKNLDLLTLTKEALIFVGKPFYFLLSHLVIATLFILYVVGYLTRTILAYPLKIKKLPIRFPEVKFPIPRIDLSTILKLIYLKTWLFLEILHVPKKKVPKFLALGLVVLVLGFIFWFEVLKDLPSPKDLVDRSIDVSTKIYDRKGVLLYKIFKDKNRTVVPLSQVPLDVRLATLAAEDAEFYNHPGISIRGIVRATFKNLKTGDLSGGSTITQQLVKNALLSSEKTYIRKIREVILSVGVELTFSKDQILEMYLNEVSYGGTVYGIQEASRQYFGKDVQNLTLSEAALLAGLPKSPTKFSPFGANPDLAKARQVEVINLMRINKFITPDEETAALSENIVLAPNKIDIKAPHFVMYVRGQLVDKYGEELVQKGGLEVVTTLDYEIQKMAERAVRDEIEKLKGFHVGNGAALVLDPKTGEILAMVGSKDYFDTAADGNVNVNVRLRQPGSSIKVVNYAYALAHGFSAATILDDSPVTFSVPGQAPYSPRDYDGTFRGKLSLRAALAESRNIPAVKVLASYGVDKMVEQGVKMGITTWDNPERFGLSLTLGGGEIKLIDLAQVYATIANYGKRPNVNSLLEIKNYRGDVLGKNICGEKSSFVVMAAEAATQTCQGEQVLDPRTAFIITDILHDNNARAPSFGSTSALVIPGHPEVAVKTGTSNDLKDNLTLGFNQDYLVATWVGNNDSSPMSRIASGVTGASPIWNRIMTELIKSSLSKNWEVPSGLVQTTICSFTGTLPCEECPVRPEWFLSESVPTRSCSPEQIQRIINEKNRGQTPKPEP